MERHWDSPARDAAGSTRRAARRAQPWPDRIARIGYVAKGAVYLLVGGLALAAALGRGTASDPTEALKAISGAGAGRVALAFVAVGLAAHAIFRALLVVADEPYAARGRLRTFGRRIKNAVSVLIYGGLAASAAALAFGWRAGMPADHDREAQQWSARALAIPYGRVLLIAIAVAILIGAVVEIARALGKNDIRRHLRVEELSERACRWLAALGRVAYLGRAAVLASVGVFLARAGIHRAPFAARGPGGAMRGAAEQPYGQVVLLLIAAGLIAFGAYAVLEARWRRLLER